MTEELKEIDIDVDHLHVGRQMGQSGTGVARTLKFETTADSNHTFDIAPNLLNRGCGAVGLSQK